MDTFQLNDWQFYFQWPEALWLLLCLPVLGWLYLKNQQAHWQQGLEFSYVSVVEEIRRLPPLWQRLLQPVCLLLTLAFLILALARPMLVGRFPQRSVDMMLVMDISLSMMATDMPPDRLTVAREAAIRFVKRLPRETRLGLEFFAGNAYVVTPPTRDRRPVLAALQRLNIKDLEPSTEIGTALMSALRGLSIETPSNDPVRAHKPSVVPMAQPVIVLLSDGDSLGGYPWELATQHAQEHHVIIHTLALGGETPTTVEYHGQTLPVSFNGATLRALAERTGGHYFRVLRAQELQPVYEQVREKSFHFEERTEEVGYLLVALSLLLLGGMMSLLWGRGLRRATVTQEKNKGLLNLKSPEPQQVK